MEIYLGRRVWLSNPADRWTPREYSMSFGAKAGQRLAPTQVTVRPRLLKGPYDATSADLTRYCHRQHLDPR